MSPESPVQVNFFTHCEQVTWKRVFFQGAFNEQSEVYSVALKITEGNVYMKEKEWEIEVQGTTSGMDLEGKVKLGKPGYLFRKLLK